MRKFPFPRIHGPDNDFCIRSISAVICHVHVKITDLIDWISLLWVSKVKRDYTKFASGDYLSYKFVTNNYTVHGETKMLINSCTVFKILQLCTFLLFLYILAYKFVSRSLCGPRK